MRLVTDTGAGGGGKEIKGEGGRKGGKGNKTKMSIDLHVTVTLLFLLMQFVWCEFQLLYRSYICSNIAPL